LALLQGSGHDGGFPGVPGEKVEQIVEGAQRLAVVGGEVRRVGPLGQSAFGGDATANAEDLTHKLATSSDGVVGGSADAGERVLNVQTGVRPKIAFRGGLESSRDPFDVRMEGTGAGHGRERQPRSLDLVHATPPANTPRRV